MPFAASRIHDIMLLLMLYPRFCIYLRFAFFPSGAAVCAQHIRRLPKGCRACQIVGSSSKIALLKSIAKIAGQEFMLRCLPSCLPPILFPSPQGRTDRCTGPKSMTDLWRTAFFSMFCPSHLQSKFRIEKIMKTMRKSRILASQNPPQTLPKSSPNTLKSSQNPIQKFQDHFERPSQIQA